LQGSAIWVTCKPPHNHKSLSGEVTIVGDRQQWLGTSFTTLTSFPYTPFSSYRRTEARSTKDSNDDTKLAAAKQSLLEHDGVTHPFGLCPLITSGNTLVYGLLYFLFKGD
jgi:hypothetical protein